MEAANWGQTVQMKKRLCGMDKLIERIKKDGTVSGEDILKVDSFLNHQIDVNLLDDMGKEFYEYFKGKNIDRILTIEASGIAVACFVARYFNVPVVIAKKTESKNLDAETYDADVFSFTKNKTYKVKVSKRYLNPDENVLIIDDFLANGKAAEGLISIVEASGAKVAGVGIVIEKAFQPGGKTLTDAGYDLYSLAVIDRFENQQPIFK